ncbi:type B DNA-directed DNA polymerase [Salinigranum salinum]|uniref:type B DNA-directed DNA polymerase n=1 Tax=Salinigranum salinum TaxID=1364937 RepID=UPI001260D1E6|nr:type B DNA-directed DNA polymerase [Salinigranum salinum]
MPFAIDSFGDGAPLAWSLTGTVDNPGWTVTRDASYRPALYAVTATGMEASVPDVEQCVDELLDFRADLDKHLAVSELCIERWRPGFRFAEQPVLRIEVDRIGAVREVGRFIERWGPPGRVPYRAFDVDFSPEFRYCLDRNVSPKPGRPPTVLSLGLSRRAAADEALSGLQIASEVVAPSRTDTSMDPEIEPAGSTARATLMTLRDRLVDEDPDVLMVERGDIIPLVAEAAREYDIELSLQRVPADGSRDDIPVYQQLAGASTFESYGQVRHSPARYNVPGRVVIDRQNTFFLKETNLAGCLDLVERSRKPLQELAWASIGNVLTAIQIREARRRGVLVQWRAWRPERFKTAADLHAADRGGTTLSPVVGFHEDVHELDFASLYPNIICKFNLSPETVRCTCHDRADVPELGYAVCDQDGYLPKVLQPIIDDRAEIKARLVEDSDAEESGLSTAKREALEGQSSALKWILVSCFGYQGFSNAKFGRIEVHEAINAYARDILFTAKERLEAGGWQVLHGIVDSIWVTPREHEADRSSLRDLVEEISAEAGISLEYEGAFEWVAFCPRRDGGAGALTRYFGRRCGREPTGGETEIPAYKYRGIECRQRSTCAWVAAVQRDLIRTLDRHRDPEAVCDRLAVRLSELRRGAVSPKELVIRTRSSKDVEAYSHRTRTVAALERAVDRGLSLARGQDIQYVVVDDDRDSLERVRLVDEIDESTSYDPSFYQTRAIRAAASVLSPLDWDSEQIERYLSDRESVPLSGFRS